MASRFRAKLLNVPPMGSLNPFALAQSLTRTTKSLTSGGEPRVRILSTSALKAAPLPPTLRSTSTGAVESCARGTVWPATAQVVDCTGTVASGRSDGSTAAFSLSKGIRAPKMA